MKNEAGGFLINSVEECAEKILWLMRNKEEAKEIGSAGKERVKNHFLLSRLLQDELKLYNSLLESETSHRNFREIYNKKTDGEKDPVCGMVVDPDNAIIKTVNGNIFYFCCNSCMEIFNENLSRYSQT